MNRLMLALALLTLYEKLLASENEQTHITIYQDGNISLWSDFSGYEVLSYDDPVKAVMSDE